MPRRFPCPRCGTPIVTVMLVGEPTRCRTCEAHAEVPTSAEVIGDALLSDARRLAAASATGPRDARSPRAFLGCSFWVGLLIGGVLTLGGVLGLGYWSWTRLPESLAGMFDPPRVPSSVRLERGWNLVGLDGQVVTIPHDRPLFVNVWATWCPPCVAELPSIDALHAAVGDRIAFLCISAEDLGTIRDFALDRGLAVPLVHAKGGLPRELQTRSIPVTFVVDRRGRIVLHHVGGADWSAPDVVAFLEELADDPE